MICIAIGEAEMYPVNIINEMKEWAKENAIEYSWIQDRRRGSRRGGPIYIYLLEQDAIAFKLRFGL